MIIETYNPTRLLSPFVKEYKIIFSDTGIINRVLPGTSPALAFRLDGQTSFINDTSRDKLPAAVFTGLRKSARLIRYEADTRMLIVLFKEVGAFTFFKMPLQELFGETVYLVDLFPQTEISVIEERLSETTNNKAKINVLETFLLSKLHPGTPADELVLSGLARIYKNGGAVKIKALAADLFVSQDVFEKRFRKHVGATPKQFASIVRMANLIRQNPMPASLTELALEYGYYDQAHFNKDFKSFTGQTPGDFFKNPSYW